MDCCVVKDANRRVSDLQKYPASSLLFYPTMIIQFMPTMVYFHVRLQGPTVIPNNWYGKRWLRPVDVPDVGNTGGKLECRLPNAHNSFFESYFRITFALLCSSFPLNYWLLKIQAVLLGHTNMHPPIAPVTIHNSQLHVLS